MIAIRWVLAHEPIELFVRAAKVFEDEVNKKAPGKLNIEVLTLTEYADKYNEGVAVNKHSLIDFMRDGKIEMSQTYTVTLGKHIRDFQALDLPFLFKNHDHATRVFEGSIGQKMLNSVYGLGVTGLAFTYSGGFRIVVGNKAINNVDDFKDVTIRTSYSPVAIDVFNAVGAKPVPMEIEELSEGIASQTVDLGESTYPRVYALNQNEVSSVVNHTEHSLFLTSILISNTLWNTLTPDLQGVIRDAAVVAAKHERELSVEDVDVVRARCVADGIEVVDLSEEAKTQFNRATSVVYEKYADYFSPSLVSDIQRA